MSIVDEVELICHRCGNSAKIDLSDTKTVHHALCSFQRGRAYGGWIMVRGRYLCPECAEGWRAVVAENDRRERDYLGIEAVEFDIP